MIHPLLACFFISFATPAALAENSTPRIEASFTDQTYRIQRNFASVQHTKHFLHQNVHEGVDTSNDPNELGDDLAVYGNGGNKNINYKLEVDQHAATLQSLISGVLCKPDLKDLSLVYRLEARDKNDQFILLRLFLAQKPFFFTVELQDYDIGSVSVVGQCCSFWGRQVAMYRASILHYRVLDHTEGSSVLGLRSEEDDSMLSKKLDSCSVYEEIEMEQLVCEKTLLHPGDILFLPRRIVHSARATSDAFSAHLTFGFNEDNVCHDEVIRRMLSKG